MIISASYKTDIPAFYSDWFMNRLRAGYCLVKNPYNQKMNRVSLLAKDIDGFVFWTRNPEPLLQNLDEIREIAPFVIQMTVTNYPVELEASVIKKEKAIDNIKKIAEKYGPKSLVWRYDPIFISPQTQMEWHYQNFSMLAQQIKGMSDEVVVSFTQFYKKASVNMMREGISRTDPDQITKNQLLDNLSLIADANDFKLTLCTQPDLLADKHPAARCVDAERLAAIGGTLFKSRVKGNRTGCYCSESRDIGGYNSCPHGCIYCYAVENRQGAKVNYKNHDPLAEHL